MIDPRFMGVVEWTDRMAATLPFPVFRLLDPEGWRGWARNLVDQLQVSGLPDPSYFDSWLDWAERLNQTVEL